MSNLLTITILGIVNEGEEEGVCVDVEFDGELNPLKIVNELSLKIREIVEKEVKVKDLTICR